MNQQSGHVSADHPHIEALRARHAMLERRIEMELKSPTANDLFLRELKLKKLHLKDEISQLAQRTG